GDPMVLDGIEYKFVVTSANDHDYLSLECTQDNELLIEAVLVSYEEQKADVIVHKNSLPFSLLKEFTLRVVSEFDRGNDS
uniref:hypothetical protein n=1 Tax=Marinimicrobium alkaliphilum TaxID=2202654 RepID=UPI001E4F95DE